MGHQADATFFERKRPWSERKDRILDYYLQPYLNKIAALRKPILLVDAFAGPGLFGDGKPGSPLIISRRVAAFQRTHPNTTCRVLCVEPDPKLHAELERNLQPHPFATARFGTFQQALPEVEREAASSSVFIYADPFAIKGLSWTPLDRVFEHIKSGRSVELLLNFNGAACVRRGRAALGLEQASGDSGDPDDPMALAASVSGTLLDEALGGNWWRAIVEGSRSFDYYCQQIVAELRTRLAARLGEAGAYDIRERLRDRVPKYSLVFASRYLPALGLVSDAVYRDLEKEVGKVQMHQRTFFDPDPESMPSLEALGPAVLESHRSGMTKNDLIAATTRRVFGMYTQTQLGHAIDELYVAGAFVAQPAVPRLADSSRLFRP